MDNPQHILGIFGLAAVILGVTYAVVAILVARRFGRRGVVVLWPVATSALVVAFVVRVRAQEALLGFPAERRLGWSISPLLFLAFGVTLGASTLVLLRRHRSANGALGFADVAGATAACVGGFVLAVVLIAILDVVGAPVWPTIR